MVSDSEERRQWSHLTKHTIQDRTTQPVKTVGDANAKLTPVVSASCACASLGEGPDTKKTSTRPDSEKKCAVKFGTDSSGTNCNENCFVSSIHQAETKIEGATQGKKQKSEA